MTKLVLDPMTSGASVAVINENFQKISDEFQNKVLYRNNTSGEANSLSTDLDTNGKRVYNLPAPALASEAARLQDVQNAISGVSTANLVAFTPYGTVEATNVQGAIQEVVSDLAASAGSSLVGFIESGAGAVVTTVQESLRDIAAVNVKQYGAVGDGVADDYAAIILARNEAVATGKRLVFPTGTYKHSQTIDFMFSNLRISGLGKVTLFYSGGSTSCISFSNAISFRYNIIFENFTIKGNGNNVGMYTANTAHCRFTDIRVIDVSDKAFYIEGSVLDVYENAVCSINETGSFITTPKYGLYLDNSAISAQAVACTFINPIMEGVSECGIYMNQAARNTFIAGTSEGNTGSAGTYNGIGLYMTANAVGNSFTNLFGEANLNGDIVCGGKANTFNSCSMSSKKATPAYESVKSVILLATATQNSFNSCTFYAGSVIAGATANIFNLCEFNYTLDDAGLRTQITFSRQLFNSTDTVPNFKPGNYAVVDGTVLDWYEEGTFTPTFGGSTTDGTIGYSIQSGSFTRIGNRVLYSITLRTNSLTTAPTGALYVRGLPYASAASPARHSANIGDWSNVTLPASRTDLTCYVTAGSTTIEFLGNATALASSSVTGAALSSATTIGISGNYGV